jgi:glucose/arabinose dehydrogenase
MDHRPSRRRLIGLACAALATAACGDDQGGRHHDAAPPPFDAGVPIDAAPPDDAPLPDAGIEASPRLLFEPIALPDDLGFLVEFAFVPGTDAEILLLDKDGHVHHVALDGDELEPLGSFTLPDVYSELDCGLISTAFDPDYASNHYVYFGYCTDDKYSAISRLSFDGSNYAEVAATAARIMTEGHDDAARPWHNVGAMGFDPDGNLWALFGDKTVPAEAQDPTSNLGALVRVVPERDPDGEGYTPAPGNPFLDDPDHSPDILAWGLRSPWRGFLDRRGRYWIGDVGGSKVEEVNVLYPEAKRNFGWPRAEGPCEQDCDDLEEPRVAWDRRSGHPYIADDPDTVPTNARVAWVGTDYVPAEIDRYDGLFDDLIPFGDICTGWIRGLAVDDDGEVVADMYLANLPGAGIWRQGPDDYLYVLAIDNCRSQLASGTGALWRVHLAPP